MKNSTINRTQLFFTCLQKQISPEIIVIFHDRTPFYMNMKTKAKKSNGFVTTTIQISCSDLLKQFF